MFSVNITCSASDTFSRKSITGFTFVVAAGGCVLLVFACNDLFIKYLLADYKRV